MQDQRPGIFDNGDHADESTDQRAEGKLTDTSASRQLYSEVGKRVQEMVGSKPKVETDRLRRIEATQTDSDIPLDDDEEPLIPDGAFISAPSPDMPLPLTYAAPGPQTETSPYLGESGRMAFGEGDEVRGWTTGLGEQQGGAPTGESVPDDE